MKAKISKNLVSLPPIRRGNWLIKISNFKDKQILVVANHLMYDNAIVKAFTDDNEAADFINFIAERDYYE